MNIKEQYIEIRKRTEALCQPLVIEDYNAQPVVDVSPPKWHLAHTTWFFEQFILAQVLKNFKTFHPHYAYLFNSYYETFGERVERHKRGNYTRPEVSEVMQYRQHVDALILENIDSIAADQHLAGLLQLGLNHEQQHQELLVTDIKYILHQEPLYPAYQTASNPVIPGEHAPNPSQKEAWIRIDEGVYQVGYDGNGFCFDNEKPRHKRYLHAFEIARYPVTNGQFMEFIENGGYEQFQWWHSEGWAWVKQHGITAPLYWKKKDGKWWHFTLEGLQPVPMDSPVTHISYYESSAYAAWRGMRLPTEFEWEVASRPISWGNRWEWTQSAYLPYPGYTPAKSAVGEYNAKFMVNQMVLRGASVATPPGHSRPTYRNFFHPHLRWQFTGIRLANHV